MKPHFTTILIPSTPTPVERSAARELQDALRRVTGETLPVLPESAGAEGRAFFIGDTVAARRDALTMPMNENASAATIV